MKVIVVTKENPEDSSILGVCESYADADLLINNDKHKNDLEAMTAEEWFYARDSFSKTWEDLYTKERNSPKKGGWLNKDCYRRDRVGKSRWELWDKLKELSGDMPFDEFWEKYKDNENVRFMLKQFFCRQFLDITKEQYDEYFEHFSELTHPKDIEYYKQEFDTNIEKQLC